MSTRERIDWVDKYHQAIGSKKRAREMMELSESSYYYDPKITRAQKEEWQADIRGKIEQIRVEQPRLGYRQLLEHLKRQGLLIGERRLRGIIRKFELQIRPRRRFVRTTQSDHDCVIYPNHI